MKAWDVVGYAAEGEALCPDCASEEYTLADLAGESDAEVSPIFASEESPEGMSCGRCGEVIIESDDDDDDDDDDDVDYGDEE